MSDAPKTTPRNRFALATERRVTADELIAAGLIAALFGFVSLELISALLRLVDGV